MFQASAAACGPKVARGHPRGDRGRKKAVSVPPVMPHAVPAKEGEADDDMPSGAVYVWAVLWALAVLAVAALVGVGAKMLIPKVELPTACREAQCYPDVTFRHVPKAQLRGDGCSGLAHATIVNPMGVATLPVTLRDQNFTAPIWGSISCATVDPGGRLLAYRQSTHGMYTPETCKTMSLGVWPVLTDGALNLEGDVREQAIDESVYHIQKYWDVRLSPNTQPSPFRCWVCHTSHLVDPRLEHGIDAAACGTPGVLLESPARQDNTRLFVGAGLVCAAVLLVLLLACCGKRAITHTALKVHAMYVTFMYGMGSGTKGVKYQDEAGGAEGDVELGAGAKGGKPGAADNNSATGVYATSHRPAGVLAQGSVNKKKNPSPRVSPLPAPNHAFESPDGRMEYSPASQRGRGMSSAALEGTDTCAPYRASPVQRAGRTPSPGAASAHSQCHSVSDTQFPPLPDPAVGPRASPLPKKSSFYRWHERRASPSPHGAPRGGDQTVGSSDGQSYSDRSQISLGMINDIEARSGAASRGSDNLASQASYHVGSRRSTNTNTSSSLARTASSYDDMRSQRSQQSNYSAHATAAAQRDHTIQKLDKVLERKRKQSKKKKRLETQRELNCTPGIGKRTPSMKAVTPPPGGVLSPSMQLPRRESPQPGLRSPDTHATIVARPQPA
eukprot:TRINITY_DN4317_c1_g1_i1.p1 TRINITY_DN4317_c1_g1~~TRINITY_DN4317_c1_g1_i1.p1  ORF type:complete len:671 (+),score=168.07 TRINITY_DN4317_c1_g1_i1:67-2079(+)